MIKRGAEDARQASHVVVRDVVPDPPCWEDLRDGAFSAEAIAEWRRENNLTLEVMHANDVIATLVRSRCRPFLSNVTDAMPSYLSKAYFPESMPPHAQSAFVCQALGLVVKGFNSCFVLGHNHELAGCTARTFADFDELFLEHVRALCAAAVLHVNKQPVRDVGGPTVLIMLPSTFLCTFATTELIRMGLSTRLKINRMFADPPQEDLAESHTYDVLVGTPAAIEMRWPNMLTRGTSLLMLVGADEMIVRGWGKIVDKVLMARERLPGCQVNITCFGSSSLSSVSNLLWRAISRHQHPAYLPPELRNIIVLQSGSPLPQNDDEHCKTKRAKTEESATNALTTLLLWGMTTLDEAVKSGDEVCAEVSEECLRLMEAHPVASSLTECIRVSARVVIEPDPHAVTCSEECVCVAVDFAGKGESANDFEVALAGTQASYCGLQSRLFSGRILSCTFFDELVENPHRAMLPGRRLSTVVLFRNLVWPGEVDNLLYTEIESQCSVFGNVSDVKIFEDVRVTKDSLWDEPVDVSFNAVRIFVEMSSYAAAAEAVKVLGVRIFGDRRVSVTLYDHERFREGSLAYRMAIEGPAPAWYSALHALSESS